MMKRKERWERAFQKQIENLRAIMQNYPDGKITDLVGANTVYSVMNKALQAGLKAGYSEEEIAKIILEARDLSKGNAPTSEARVATDETLVITP